MADVKPVIWWVRRDMRLSDNAALTAAVEAGGPVIPVFILDELVETYGTMPKWRMGLGAEAFGTALAEKGSRLILRRGAALQTLRDLIKETGADTVIWTRLVDPYARELSEKVKAGLEKDGIRAVGKPGHVLFPPWTVETGSGSYYKVFTPFWRAVKDRDVADPLNVPGTIPAPENWPESATIQDWALAAPMDRGADIVFPHLTIGETAARGRLGAFMSGKVAEYAKARDLPATDGTSLLSENLTLGEISAATCWHAGRDALLRGHDGAETFLQELVWRDFAHHLAYHTPHLADRNWREDWDAFPWNEDERTTEVKAWKRGRTGIPFVDAAMRELYVTGYMHNRGRMIVGSYLCKHLMSHWRIGQQWFEDTLRDWDPASNAMGWQWVAGSGPDATPYFRVFNPNTQLDRFDKGRDYVDGWIAERSEKPSKAGLAYFDAIPRSWGLSAKDPYPDPIVTADDGRKRALAAYENRSF